MPYRIPPRPPQLEPRARAGNDRHAPEHALELAWATVAAALLVVDGVAARGWIAADGGALLLLAATALAIAATQRRLAATVRHLRARWVRRRAAQWLRSIRPTRRLLRAHRAVLRAVGESSGASEPELRALRRVRPPVRVGTAAKPISEPTSVLALAACVGLLAIAALLS